MLHVRFQRLLSSSFFFFFFFSSFLNHQDYVLIVRVLLLEHSHEVVSTASVYFVKLVPDVRQPAISNSLILEGRKVAQPAAVGNRYSPLKVLIHEMFRP